MGKFFVIVLAALFLCGIVTHYVPGVCNEAFAVHGNSINWIMLIGIGFVWGGYRLSGK